MNREKSYRKACQSFLMCHNITKRKKDAEDDLKWYKSEKKIRRLQPISVAEWHNRKMLAFVLLFSLFYKKIQRTWFLFPLLLVHYNFQQILVHHLLVCFEFCYYNSVSIKIINVYIVCRGLKNHEIRRRKNSEWSLSAWTREKKIRFVCLPNLIMGYSLISIFARWPQQK